MDGRAKAFRLSWPRRRVRGQRRVVAVMSLSERPCDRLFERTSSEVKVSHLDQEGGEELVSLKENFFVIYLKQTTSLNDALR